MDKSLKGFNILRVSMPAVLKNRSKRRMLLVDTDRDMASSPRMDSCLHDKVAIALSALSARTYFACAFMSWKDMGNFKCC